MKLAKLLLAASLVLPLAACSSSESVDNDATEEEVLDDVQNEELDKATADPEQADVVEAETDETE